MSMSSDRQIMFAGVSGVGKTTLAKLLSEQLGIPFISGSYSDLVPETKDMPHKDMINQDADTVFKQDMQLLNLRHKRFRTESEYVSDRSYFDSAAYFINKLSHRIPPCELEHAVELCKMLLSQQCTHLIFIPYSDKFFKEWVIEDNDKRILSKYYQFEVSQIMFGLLKLWGYKPASLWDIAINGITSWGTMELIGYKIKVLILDELNLDKRMYITSRFLQL